MKKLSTYAAKRDFTVTSEPRAKHRQRRRTFFRRAKTRRTEASLRLSFGLDGVLKSWAVPKGPSLSPGEKRLAVEVEDHPIDYRNFEGTIPHGQYGGGRSHRLGSGDLDARQGIRTGLKRDTCAWCSRARSSKEASSLIRLKTRDNEKRNNWLLMKTRDEYASEGDLAESRRSRSVLTGRTIEDIASGVTADAKEPAPTTGTPSGKTSPTKKAHAAAIPSVEPQLATLVDAVPAGPGWVFEMKLDGYRAIATVDGGKVQLASRTGKEWSDRFQVIAQALARVRVKDAVLDGEICYLGDDGRTRFQGLRECSLRQGSESPRLHDLRRPLSRRRRSARDRPLLERKEILATLLAGERLPLRLCQHMEGDGQANYGEACRLDLEGVIAKRADAAYASGRTRSWLKIKCGKRQEVVILGFTAPKGRRSGLGAIVVGVRGTAGKGSLRYVGKVGTGFSAKTLTDLHRKLKTIVRTTPPVSDAPRMRDVTWVEPELVCEVRFTEWTNDGALRHPAFMGLREDKPAADVVREDESTSRRRRSFAPPSRSRVLRPHRPRQARHTAPRPSSFAA